MPVRLEIAWPGSAAMNSTPRGSGPRLRFVRRQVTVPDLGGDPMAGEVPEAQEPRATLLFDGSSRAARRAMARACQEGVRTLRLQVPGVVDRSDTQALLLDALRLRLPRVEANGDVRPLAALSDPAVVGLRGLARVVATTSPDADPAEIDAVLARLVRLTGLTVLRLDPGCEDSPPED